MAKRSAAVLLSAGHNMPAPIPGKPGGLWHATRRRPHASMLLTAKTNVPAPPPDHAGGLWHATHRTRCPASAFGVPDGCRGCGYT